MVTVDKKILTVWQLLCTWISSVFVLTYVDKYVTGFEKTNHIVTIDILRNTDLKYLSRHGSLVLDCSHAIDLLYN